MPILVPKMGRSCALPFLGDHQTSSATKKKCRELVSNIFNSQQTCPQETHEICASKEKTFIQRMGQKKKAVAKHLAIHRLTYNSRETTILSSWGLKHGVPLPHEQRCLA